MLNNIITNSDYAYLCDICSKYSYEHILNMDIVRRGI